MDFIEFAYRRLNGELRTEDYIQWADELLVAGHDEPSIAELSSCIWDRAPDPAQVERLFQSCVQELGLAIPADWEEAFDAYTTEIWRRVVDNALEPEDCMSIMLELADDNNTPYILWVWIDLARNLWDKNGGFIDFNDGLNLENSAECIRKTALQLLTLSSKPLALKFPWVWYCHQCEAVSDDNTFTKVAVRHCLECGAQSASGNMRFFRNRQALADRDTDGRKAADQRDSAQ